jgi:hypothetical protein
MNITITTILDGAQETLSKGYENLTPEQLREQFVINAGVVAYVNKLKGKDVTRVLAEAIKNAHLYVPAAREAHHG